MNLSELHELSNKVKEQFVLRMRSIYGECLEFLEWEDAFDFADKYPTSKEAWAISEAALIELIRTKHYDFKRQETNRR